MLQVFFLGLIRLYTLFLSPLVGHHCRFQPTCSVYMKQAILQHGTYRGIMLGSRRLCRCHPFSKADMDDPVPSRTPR